MFEQYGIKEVADVTLYSIHRKKDGSGDVYYIPALYLDTLKISSIDKTADNVWAQGGIGNARLICWDYGKTINLSLEDALCTPASLGLCWGGVLSADWHESDMKQDFGIKFNDCCADRISRMEKAFYPKCTKQKRTISYLLPQLNEDLEQTEVDGIIKKSAVVDGTRIEGFGYVKNKIYNWKMYIESSIKSIAVVPDRFFDKYGKSYPISQITAIGVKLPTQVEDFKIEIIYKINGTDPNYPRGASIINVSNKPMGEGIITQIRSASFLKIRVDNNDNYHAFLGTNSTTFSKDECFDIDTSIFKGIDMWNSFEDINELIYFLITKYENDIIKIDAADIIKGEIIGEDFEAVFFDSNEETDNKKGKLWAYVNPKTMRPYPDDYWFHQGESYYIKSITFAPKGKKLSKKKITITAGQFPGMYMLVGETYIRARDTGEDERMQIRIPLCKILSNQTLTLQADGDPTTFNMEVEVAKPENGVMMEIIPYEIRPRMVRDEYGYLEIKDGSTEVVAK